MSLHAIDGGASVGGAMGVATHFPRKQEAIEHQYDPLVKKAKKQDGRSMRDEGIDVGENDHNYHILEGPDNDYNNLDEQEKDIVYHILDGPTPIEPELKSFQNTPNKAYTGEFLKKNKQIIMLLLYYIKYSSYR